MDTLLTYTIMLLSAFGAATLLPLASEAVLVAKIKAGAAAAWPLAAVATVGNVAGSVFNWWLGLNMRRFAGRRWFPFKPPTIAAATDRFNRYGRWSLLFAWLPVVGDPLTFVAGVLRVPLIVFLPLVAIGKGLRYAVLVAAL